MAKEYIEREEVIKILEHYDLSSGSTLGCHSGAIECAISAIEMLPAADVTSVRHGRWEFGKDLPDSFGSISKNKYHLYCSECRNQAFNKSTDNDCDFDMDTPFCPWCGAKIDKEDGE